MKRRQIPPPGGKYEETGRAIGAMERPAIQPAMKEGEKPSSKKSKHKDDACGQGDCFPKIYIRQWLWSCFDRNGRLHNCRFVGE
ncbi:hypothetical protein A9Z06_01615 [Rhizobium sp. YK2]|nr:hypothetical protein A9Z06_01615 [Rhizobium sp. YK2]